MYPFIYSYLTTLDLTVIRDEILNIMIAGRDTVSIRFLVKPRIAYSN